MDCAHCSAVFDARPHQRFCSNACRHKARHAKPAAPTGPRKVMLIGDVHVPYHDRRAWDCVVAAAEALRPDVLVLLGDFVDCYVVSKFDREPTRYTYLADELREARVELAKLPEIPLVYFLEGNHEHRLSSYITRNAPALSGLVSMRDALGIDRRGWHWVPYPSHVDVGDLRCQHEPLVGGANGAQKTLERGGGRSWAFGHTHHGAVACGGSTDGYATHVINTGWLGDFDSLAFRYMPPIRARQLWRHGFGLVYQDAGKTLSAQFVQVVDGACVVNGQRVAA